VAEEGFENLINIYNTPAERIIRILLDFKKLYLKDDPEMTKNFNYAIT
jgi:hypothetical protein